MLIVADENIPLIKDCCKNLGATITLPGRTITSEQVKSADLLFVRSITPVNSTLLDHSLVKFVGTATTGIDHIDIDYLNQKKITFAAAIGSNANSVAEYIVSALLYLAKTYQWDLSQKSLGIVGFGNIGKRVAHYAKTLGLQVLLYDPPLADQQVFPSDTFVSLTDLSRADIITFHVPLTSTGAYPTHDLCNKSFLSQLSPDQVIINTSRGSVVNNKDLLECLEKNKLKTAILDVWENEPFINYKLLEKVLIGTPHIAGYSWDGKIKGTEMVYESACKFLNVPLDPTPFEQQAEKLHLTNLALASLENDQVLIREIVHQAYDIERDSKALKKTAPLPKDQKAGYFDQLRKNYPKRREFINYSVRIPSKKSLLLKELNTLGFSCSID